MNASKRASGVAAQPARKRLTLGALCRCTPKGLAKISAVREARSCQGTNFRPRPDMQTRLPRRVLRFWVLVCGLAKEGHTRGRFRAFCEPARLSPAHQPD